MFISKDCCHCGAAGNTGQDIGRVASARPPPSRVSTGAALAAEGHAGRHALPAGQARNVLVLA